MKKLAYFIAVALATPTAVYADTAEQSSASNISDLSSTADTPNNLYDFIDNDKLSGVAYGGAEIGGSVLFDSENNFEHWDMFKVGADFTYEVNDSLSILFGGEARYAWSGFDTNIKPLNYVDRFTFGVNTAAGKTTYGKQCGIADVYLGFADISKEFGLGAEADEVACTEEQFNHHYITENFDVGAAYEHTNDAWAVGGSFTAGPVVVGGTYVQIGHSNNHNDDNVQYSDVAETVYTIGAVAQFDKVNVAAKYAFNEVESNQNNDYLETTGYALGLAYQATTNLSIATTYNAEDYAGAVAGTKGYDSDDWFTIGASYRVNEHMELVTDYKAASENDDKLFLRANLSL